MMPLRMHGPPEVPLPQLSMILFSFVAVIPEKMPSEELDPNADKVPLPRKSTRSNYHQENYGNPHGYHWILPNKTIVLVLSIPGQKSFMKHFPSFSQKNTMTPVFGTRASLCLLPLTVSS